MFANNKWYIETKQRRTKQHKTTKIPVDINFVDNDTLNNLGYFPSGNWGGAYGGSENLTEVGDLALTNGNIYSVTHNPLGSPQHNGILILYGSGVFSY